MSEVMQNIQALEQYIEGQKEVASFADAVMRLQSNPDFKLVINDGFMLHQAARYAQESGDPALSAVQRQDALNLAQASGHLKRFLSVAVVMGNDADQSILNAQQQLNELRAEA